MFDALSTDKVVWVGDSITALGTYDELFAWWGGYFLGGSAIYPPEFTLGTVVQQLRPQFINKGIPGNKAQDVANRLTNDVISLNPTVVGIAVGVNDLLSTTDEDFSEIYNTEILDALKNALPGVRIICMSIFCHGEDRTIPGHTNIYDGDLDSKNAIIAAGASRVGATYIDLRTPQLAYEVIHNPDNDDHGILCVDLVHPNNTGKAFIVDVCQSNINLVPL